MENVKQGFFKRIDSRNFNFTTRILLLTISIVSLILIIYFSLGLGTLTRALTKTSHKQLEELTYTKTSELEMHLRDMKKNLSEISQEEEMRTASEDLISSFLSLSDEQQNLFSEERLSSVSQELSSYYSGTIAENSPVTDDRF